MTAGRRDQLITLSRFTTTQDEYGEEIQAWAPIGTEWAAIFYGAGSERRQAAMEQASQTATFQILANELTRSLTVQDRIEFNGNWDIQSISPMQRGLIEATAIRGAS